MLTTNTTNTHTNTAPTTSSHNTQSSPTPTTHTSPFKRAVTLVLALVVCLVGTAVMFSGCKKDEEITVTTVENGEVIVKKIKKDDLVAMPNVVGMNKDEAVKTLENLGLVVEINSKFDYNKEQNDKTITVQSEDANSIINKGSNVVLTVNSIEYPFNYELNEDGTLSIVYSYVMDYIDPLNKPLVVPNEVQGIPVTRIKEGGIQLSYYNLVVEIPESITTIDENGLDGMNLPADKFHWEVIIHNSKDNVNISENQCKTAIIKYIP